MSYAVRDWMVTARQHANLSPRLAPISTQFVPWVADDDYDYDLDAIRLLIDQLGERYRRDFPGIAAHVAQLKDRTAPPCPACGSEDWRVWKDKARKVWRRSCRACSRRRDRQRRASHD